jgi:hypothetical protein
MNLKFFYDLFDWSSRDMYNEDWHRKIPLVPHFTLDKHLVWLLPAWRRYIPPTNWECDNWYYEWLARRSKIRH